MVKENLNILMIATLPPPLTGQSVATNALYQYLRKEHRVTVLNLSKESYSAGVNSVGRIFSMFILFARVIKNIFRSDVIYLTIAQSKFGVLRDLIIMLLCVSKLNKVVLHSHGNGIKSTVYDRNFILRFLSAYFFRRVHALIILGKSSEKVFNEVIEYDKMHIVRNFALNELFISEKSVKDKHTNTGVVNILFLSNFIAGKGYSELVGAFFLLPRELQCRIQINFAGAFEDNTKKEEFLNTIRSHPELKYLGIINGEDKRLVLKNSHIFCLPTYYQFEGQPISILEAYASGCAVITTDHAGILDIFKNGRNGVLVEIKSINSLAAAIEYLCKEYLDRMNFALNNFSDAREFYQEGRFCQEIENIFKGVNSVSLLEI